LSAPVQHPGLTLRLESQKQEGRDEQEITKEALSSNSSITAAPWPIAYGYEASNASVGQETVQVTAAEASAKPSWTAFGRAIGGVNPGDLFHVDATNSPADISVTLYLTNAEELVHAYR